MIHLLTFIVVSLLAALAAWQGNLLAVVCAIGWALSLLEHLLQRAPR